MNGGVVKFDLMGTKVLQNFQNSRVFSKSPFMEMNEPPANVKNFSFKRDIFQPKNLSYSLSQTQGKPHQGSTASLESRSFVYQSEDQPLTEVHPCRYDECHKFRQSKTEQELFESPVTPLKTFFLVLVIFLLIVWIIIYTILTKLKIL